MIDFFKIAVVKEQSIDWHMTDGKYKEKYRDRIVMDNLSIYYCPPDGSILYNIMCSFTLSNGENFFAPELWEQIILRQWEQSNDSQKSEKLDIESLIHLKASGHTVEEILKLKKEGVI